MGQPVNPLLGNTQALLGADPELYRQQLVQAEQQRIQALPPQQALAAQLGTLFGRGLGNVATGQNFFEVTNPVLQNLTKIQNVYNTAMQAADPNDPLSFYKELQTRFADAGLGVQALMASEQLRRTQSELTKAKGEEIRTKSAQIDYYAKNPDELMSEIAKQRGLGTEAGNTKANELAGLLGQVTYARDLDRAKQIADIELKNAQTETQKAQALNFREQIASGKYDFKVIAQNGVTPSHIVIIDKKTGEEKVKPLSENLFGGTPPPAAGAASKEKPSAAQFDKRNQPAAPASPTASTPAPAAAPAQVAPVAASPYNQETGTYRIALDPEYQQIQADAQANLIRLQTEPAYQAEINQRIQALQAKIQRNFGNRVVIQ